MSKQDNEQETVRLTIEQVVEKADSLFAEADAAIKTSEKMDKKWLAYAQEYVAPHLGAVYDNAEQKAKFRYAFYVRYFDKQGEWKPAAPAKTRGEDYGHYSNLKASAKDTHPTSNSIKVAMNRAKMMFARVMEYTKDILESKDTETRSGPRPITELFLETIEKLLKQSDKVIEKIQLGPVAAQHLKLLRDSAALLKTAGFGK